jgi:hypothetical protein
MRKNHSPTVKSTHAFIAFPQNWSSGLDGHSVTKRRILDQYIFEMSSFTTNSTNNAFEVFLIHKNC